MSSFQEPTIPLNQNSLRVINSALKAYSADLKKRQPLPAETLGRVATLRLKLAPFLREGGFPEGTVLPLRLHEFHLLAQALHSFLGQIRHHIPSSPERTPPSRSWKASRTTSRPT